MRLTQKGWSLFYIGCRRVVGRLRQSSASLHPPSGTSFLREPLTRPRPATLCRSLPATTQLFPGAVRAEKNRRCHFLVTKRPQLKRYPQARRTIFSKTCSEQFLRRKAAAYIHKVAQDAGLEERSSLNSIMSSIENRMPLISEFQLW